MKEEREYEVQVRTRPLQNLNLVSFELFRGRLAVVLLFTWERAEYMAP